MFQVKCGSVFVTSKDTVQKIKSTILTTNIKHKKSGKHAVALGTSFGHGKYLYFDFEYFDFSNEDLILDGKVAHQSLIIDLVAQIKQDIARVQFFSKALIN